MTERHEITTVCLQETTGCSTRHPIVEECTELTSYASLPTTTPSSPEVPIPRFLKMATVGSEQHELFLRSLNLFREEHRLLTFCGCWSSRGNLSRRAAKEGLFFLSSDDRVQCFSCGRVFSNWSGIGDPVFEHRRPEPTCAMVLGRESRNISSEHRESDLATLLRQHVPQYRALNEEKLLYESYRLSTFRSLPTSSRIDIRHFAAAGFYYTQRRNDVMCFFCSIVLRDQPADADPFSLCMHKRSCRFVRREDDCGNVGLGQSGSRHLLDGGDHAQPAGELLTHRVVNRNQTASLTGSQGRDFNYGEAGRCGDGVSGIKNNQDKDLKNFQHASQFAPHSTLTGHTTQVE